MNRKSLLVAIASFLMISGFIPAISAFVPRPDHLIIATIAEPATVDPAWAYDTGSRELIFNVYDTLIFFKVDETESIATSLLLNPPGVTKWGKTDEFVPSLATEWTISPDGLTYTFKMRDGVNWHDMTFSSAAQMAAHAEWTFERWMILDRSGGPTWMILEPLLGVYSSELTAAYATAVDNAVESFTNATGSYVQFNLVIPYTPFLTIIAQSWAGVVNKAWCVAQGGFPGFDVTGYDPAARARARISLVAHNWLSINRRPSLVPSSVIVRRWLVGWIKF